MASFVLDRKGIDYDKLPSLVRKGEDREVVLAALVDAWSEQIDVSTDIPEPTIGVTLDRVALVDANTGEPIDLGVLLRSVSERIAFLGPADGAAFSIVVTLRGCHVPQARASESNFRFTLIAVSCRFGLTDFRSALFRGNVAILSTSFRGSAWFSSATFCGDALFESTSFRGVAGFENAIFCGAARFEMASFRGHARFSSAYFHGHAVFTAATFRGETRFVSASFLGHAWFESALFRSGVWFGSATFLKQAWFKCASFLGSARFSSASFCGDVVFASGTFAVNPRFSNAEFSDQQIFVADGSFGTAVFQADSQDTASFGRPAPARLPSPAKLWWRNLVPWLVQGLHRARWRAWTRSDAERLRWDVVRGFGELAILTRVSMSALVFVPTLTALWPLIRYLAEDLGGRDHGLPESMPWVWAALFFAAVLVVLGRVLYQAFVPQQVREASRVDFIAGWAKTYREATPHEREQHLREAIEAVDEAGSDALLRWFRHRRLVYHHGRVVWIPERIEDFEYEPTEITPRDKGDDAPDAEPDEGEAGDDPKFTAEPVMPPESRKMIAIWAGADARYDLIARQNRQWARASLWCYVLAVVLVLVVLWDQSLAITREIGLDALAGALQDRAAPALVVVIAAITAWIIWDAWMGWLRLPWIGTLWERIKNARSGFTPIDEMEAETQRRLRASERVGR